MVLYDARRRSALQKTAVCFIAPIAVLFMCCPSSLIAVLFWLVCHAASPHRIVQLFFFIFFFFGIISPLLPFSRSQLPTAGCTRLNGVAFTPNGDLAAVGCANGALYVLDVESGQLLCTVRQCVFRGHDRIAVAAHCDISSMAVCTDTAGTGLSCVDMRAGKV